jgi:hypothetical protein
VDILGEIAAARQRSGQRCLTCDWLNSLPEADADQFRTALADKQYAVPAIHRVMASRGFAGSESAVGNHRRYGHG